MENMMLSIETFPLKNSEQHLLNDLIDIHGPLNPFNSLTQKDINEFNKNNQESEMSLTFSSEFGTSKKDLNK